MAIQSEVILMNWYLERRLQATRDGLELAPKLDDDENRLRLFTNDWEPTPASDSLAGYTEANYSQYAALETAGDWGPVVQIQNGQYGTRLALQVFAVPDAAPAQTIYGLYYTTFDGATERALFAVRLANPYLAAAGEPPLRVYLWFDDWCAKVLIDQACN